MAIRTCLLTALPSVKEVITPQFDSPRRYAPPRLLHQALRNVHINYVELSRHFRRLFLRLYRSFRNVHNTNHKLLFSQRYNIHLSVGGVCHGYSSALPLAAAHVGHVLNEVRHALLGLELVRRSREHLCRHNRRSKKKNNQQRQQLEHYYASKHDGQRTPYKWWHVFF